MISSIAVAAIRGMLITTPSMNKRKNNLSNESMRYLTSREAGKANSDSAAKRKNFFATK